MKKKLLIISSSIIVLDFIIKIIIQNTMKLNSSIEIIKDFFYITYVRNTGAAFSILRGNRFFLLLITFITLIILIYFIKKTKITKYQEIIYGILFGGIIGNLIDRIFYSCVIDYLDFYPLGYSFPIFNLADICIVVSVFLIIINMWGEKNENN